MKIELTKKHFKTLLKMAYLGNWVVNSVKDAPDGDFEETEQFVLSLAKDFGYEQYVGFDEEIKKHFPTEEFEEKTGISDMIGEYNMYTVWEELVLALSRRDLVREYGEDGVANMSEDELIEKEFPYMMTYEEEFRENGLSNLAVVKKGNLNLC
jgi:hypothetical protein